MRKSILIIISSLSTLFYAYSQQEIAEKAPIVVKVSGYQQLEVDIILRDSIPYMPVSETFEYLGIKTEIGDMRSVIRGFFRSPDSAYIIDIADRRAENWAGSYLLNDRDFISDGGAIYLRADFIAEFFGIDIKYDPRSLAMRIGPSHYLPSVQYQKLQRRTLIRQKKGVTTLPEADFIIDRDPWTTGAGKLSWYTSSRFTDKISTTNYTFFLNSKVAGGDLDLSLRGIYHSRFSRDPNFTGYYRIPFPDNPSLQQIIIGRRINNGLLPLDVMGAEFTNRPLGSRLIFTESTFSGITEPSTIIEYTGELTGKQFSQVGGDGSYQLEVPVYYGRSTINFRTYDRYGKRGIIRYYLNAPRSALPSGEFEYSSFIGKRTHVGGQYVMSNYANVGLTSRLTIGTIIDYYDISSLSRKWHGALTSTARLQNSLIFFGKVSPSSTSQLQLNFQPGSLSEFDVKTIWYSRTDPYNFGKKMHRWEFFTNFPVLPGNKIRMSFLGVRTQYDRYREYQLDASVVGLFGKITPQIATRIIGQEFGSEVTYPIQYTSFALGAQLPLEFLARTEFIYNHLLHDIVSIRFDVTKSVFHKLQMHFAYERLPLIPVSMVSLSVRYLFPFLDVRGIVTKSNSNVTYGLNIRGSTLFDVPGGSYVFKNMPQKQIYGGFRLNPYLDVNNNDRRDDDEPVIERNRIYVQNKSVERTPVLMQRNKLFMERLNPYQYFQLYFDPQSLEDPALVPKYSSIRFFTEPNYIKEIDLPIVYSAVIRGSVTDSSQIPLEDVTIRMKRLTRVDGDTMQHVKTVKTFSTGEFEFIMVPPGEYLIEVDQSTISSFGYVSRPSSRRVTVVSKMNGDIIENISFTLYKN